MSLRKPIEELTLAEFQRMTPRERRPYVQELADMYARIHNESLRKVTGDGMDPEDFMVALFLSAPGVRPRDTLESIVRASNASTPHSTV